MSLAAPPPVPGPGPALSAPERERLSEAALRELGVDALLERVAGKDEAAFRVLYETQAAKLLGIARRIVITREAAEDVVQDVFVKLWNGTAAFDRAIGSGAGFLATITRNRALDIARKRRESALDEGSAAEIPDERPSPETIVFARAELRALLGCLDKLGEQPRKVIVAAYLDGLTGPEIARRMNVPLGTVKTWISRGLVRLKECLGR